MAEQIAVIDYGVGNIYSLVNAIKKASPKPIDIFLAKNADQLLKADRAFLPGVGSFGACMDKLQENDLHPAIIEFASKKPMLGICVGMQILFEHGFEYGEHRGLGLLKGGIKRFESDRLKIPNMGWRRLVNQKNHPLNQGIDGEFVYFVHSYGEFGCEDAVSTSEYGQTFSALVAKENLFGSQFHPEKSSKIGLKILKNFLCV